MNPILLGTLVGGVVGSLWFILTGGEDSAEVIDIEPPEPERSPANAENGSISDNSASGSSDSDPGGVDQETQLIIEETENDATRLDDHGPGPGSGGDLSESASTS